MIAWAQAWFFNGEGGLFMLLHLAAIGLAWGASAKAQGTPRDGLFLVLALLVTAWSLWWSFIALVLSGM